jgi:drug/metabolite transporter (DMT)-like permease
MIDQTNQAPAIQVAALTALAMIAFAANSILCRMAIETNLIDAVSFTTIRLLSGTFALLLILALREKRWRPSKPTWQPVLALLAYMVCFSFAYRSLSAGTGALLLFGFVQLMMIGTAIYQGERLTMRAWLGLTLAGGGIVYLVLPGVEAPDPIYSALMAIAGLAWGAYSLLGLRGEDPTSATANNFLYATPIAVLISVFDSASLHLTWRGMMLGIASGAIASGMGYAIWYSALKNIKPTTAAITQLSVPVLATLGGVMLLAEPLTLRILIAAVLTIGGIGLFLRRSPDLD